MWQLKSAVLDDNNAVSLINKLIPNLADENIFEEMPGFHKLSRYFKEDPPKGYVHMLVRRGK